MSRFFPSSSSSAAAAASDAPQWELISAAAAAKPPTATQLSQLLSLPSAMYQASLGADGRRSGGKGKKKGRGRAKGGLARDGQVISKTFDTFGRRPQPTNGLSLEQEVQLEMEFTVQNFASSSATAGIPSFASLTVSASLFTGTTALTGVFDQYRFDQVEVWLEFQAPNGTAPMPELLSAVDLDDSNTPTSVSQVQDHIGALVSMGPAGHYHKWRPHIAIASFSGAFTSYANVPSTWIDSASPNVQHYGLKTAMLSNGGAFNVSAVIRAVISFRAPSIN